MDADIVARIWNRDSGAWGPGEDDPAERLGWLDLPERMSAEIDSLRSWAGRSAGFRHVVLLGMGGSSLAPEVFGRVLGGAPDAPALKVLDSTHPRALVAAEADLDPERALFVVSSKSGTTVETMSLYRHFRERCPPDRFVAVTDPDTPLARLAEDDGWLASFVNPPDVGGRFSALSLFGLVPAALVGIDPAGLLDPARAMAERCRIEGEGNPGLELGWQMGHEAREGRNKLTFVSSEPLEPFGDWVEQLIAESSGKGGAGIVPVVHEPPADPERYGRDRLFVNLRLQGDAAQDARVGKLVAAGHPVIRIEVPGIDALSAEMFRWEFATAVACSVLGVNAFDQPDVESAKRAAKEALGAAHAEPWPEDDPAELFSGIGPDEIACLLLFTAPDEASAKTLRNARARLVAESGVATSAGFGPRYLHSTGQLHKGGPPGVRAVVVWDEPEEDVAIPGAPHGFARLAEAQARGDARALDAAGRRVARTTRAVFETWAAS